MVVVCLSSLSFTSVAVVAIGVTALRLGDGGGRSALSLLHLFGDVGDGNGGQLDPASWRRRWRPLPSSP